MNEAVTAVIGAVSGVISALVVGVVAVRSVLTRKEHNEECDRRLGPIHKSIDEVKEGIKDLNKKQDESTRDLSNQIQEVLRQVQINGGRSRG